MAKKKAVTLDGLMQEAKVSPSMLCRELGITYPTLQNYRNGKTKPDIDRAKLMSGVLGVTLETISDCFPQEAKECVTGV